MLRIFRKKPQVPTKQFNDWEHRYNALQAQIRAERLTEEIDDLAVYVEQTRRQLTTAIVTMLQGEGDSKPTERDLKEATDIACLIDRFIDYKLCLESKRNERKFL